MFAEGLADEHSADFQEPLPTPDETAELMPEPFPADWDPTFGVQRGAENDPLRDYIGRKPRFSIDIAGMILDKADAWENGVTSNGLMRQAKENFRQYMNADPDGTGYSAASFSVVGENGEMMSVRFNEMRSLIGLILNMTISQKQALQTKAANSDPESLEGAQIFDNVVTYYLSHWKRSRSEKAIMKAVELGLISPFGAVLLDWDPNAGSDYLPGAPGQPTTKSGDLYLKARSFWDVYFDTSAEDDDELNWIIVRDFENRYDYASRYPDKALEILALESKTDLDGTYHYGWDDKTDLIPVYKFYHRSTPTCPRGRVVHVLNRELVTVDQDNPFVEADTGQAVFPVLFVRSAEGLGSLFGYAAANDLGPVQRVYNMIWSGVVTNEAAFGVGNITAERGSDISVQTLAGGMNLIEYAEGKKPPEAFTVGGNQRQSLEVLSMVRNQGEKISGANATVRGDPDSSLKAASGRALGLIQAMFVQSQASIQRSHQQLLQDFGNTLLLILKQFAHSERVTSIAGKDRVMLSSKWTSSTFKGVARVVCEPVNPLSKTIAGNREEAELLLSQGMVLTPEQYFTVRNTGQLEPMVRPEETHNTLINRENSDLLKGLQTPTLRTDKHDKHIEAHLVLLDSPEVRRNADEPNSPAATIMAHIAGHEKFFAEAQAQATAQQMQLQTQQQTQAPQKGGGGSKTAQPQRQSEEQISAGEKEMTLPNGQTVPIPNTAQIPGAQ